MPYYKVTYRNRQGKLRHIRTSAQSAEAAIEKISDRFCWYPIWYKRTVDAETRGYEFCDVPVSFDGPYGSARTIMWAQLDKK